MDFEIRAFTDHANLRLVEDLQARIWGATERDLVPYHQLQVSAGNGGLVLVALQESEMVGFVYAFPAVRQGRLMLYSHLAGVVPQFRRRGIALALKRGQAAWAQDHGYDRILWTFDPLQAGNASLNLHKLGATGRHYYLDYYGEIYDDINRGMPSDRLEVEWLLQEPRLDLSGRWQSASPLLVSRDGEPHCLPRASGPAFSLEIPRQLSRSTFPAWRSAIASAFQELFAEGLAAVDFRLDGATGQYLVC